jgi:hypothetical protein
MPLRRSSCHRLSRATLKKKRQRMSLRSSDNIAATLSARFGCDASQLSTSAQGRCLAGDRGGGPRVATILRRDVMATVSPSLMALSTVGKARRISRTEAVFIVNNYVSPIANVKTSAVSAWISTESNSHSPLTVRLMQRYTASACCGSILIRRVRTPTA